MNIIPLIFAFILIFAISSYTFVHNLRATLSEKNAFANAMHIHRNLICSVQDKLYRSQKGKNLHPKKKSTAKPSKKPLKTSPRSEHNPYYESTLNLFSLMAHPDPKLEAIALDLLQKLYALAPFYTPGLENKILHLLLDTLKKNPTLTTLEKLFPKIPVEEQKLFYTLLKGTENYVLCTNKGIPPLGDFISIDPSSHKKPIHFPYASSLLLEAAFGPTLAPQLLHKELTNSMVNRKYKPFTKQELEAFLATQNKNLSSYEEFLYFGTNKKPRPKFSISSLDGKSKRLILKN